MYFPVLDVGLAHHGSALKWFVCLSCERGLKNAGTLRYMCNAFIILINKYGWVAVQYHWILDESVLYLGESVGRAKYKQDESNDIRWLPIQ